MVLRTEMDVVEANADTYRQRRDVLVEGLNRIGWKVQKPRATMFVWAQIPEAYCHLSSMDFAMKLKFASSPERGSVTTGRGMSGLRWLRMRIVSAKP